LFVLTSRYKKMPLKTMLVHLKKRSKVSNKKITE